MVSSTFIKHALFFLLSILATFWIAQASDPNILTDLIVPTISNTSIDGNFFTSAEMRGLLVNSINPLNFKVTKATIAEIPALKSQSVSMAVLQFPAGGVNPPHIHPHSTKLLFVVEGSMEVVFVDTANKLYTQTLQLGDMFVFPKGLAHFQYNADAKNQATAISAFGSANVGTISIPMTLFTTRIDNVVVAKSFKTDVATIQKIKAGHATKA